jgi:hypothetical protein
MTIEYWRCQKSGEFLDQWQGVRGNQELPGRKDIEPRNFTAFLPQMVLVEEAGEGQVTIRLAGTALVERCGVTLTGMKAGAFLNKDQLLRFNEPLLEAIRTQAGCRMVGHLYTHEGGYWDIEMTFLPYRQESNRETRLVGYISSNCGGDLIVREQANLKTLKIDFFEVIRSEAAIS